MLSRGSNDTDTHIVHLHDVAKFVGMLHAHASDNSINFRMIFIDDTNDVKTTFSDSGEVGKSLPEISGSDNDNWP